MIRTLVWLALAGLIIGLFYLDYREGKQWEHFLITHECRVVVYEAEQTVESSGISARGEVVFGWSTIPATTTYLCNDGVEYRR